jgi:CRISPR-associated endonuclease Cas3-HD
MMDNAFTNLWAKTGKTGDQSWHPLILHMLDVAATADAILDREPESTRKRMAEILGMKWDNARPWILFVISCHDLGKACPGFQSKWKNLTGLQLPRSPNTDINHAYVSQIALAELLREKGWPEELAELIGDAIGCHHGERASEHDKGEAEYEIYTGRGQRYETIRHEWLSARRDLVKAAMEVLAPHNIPDNPCVTRNGKRLGLFQLEEQEKWLVRKGFQHGFSLPQLASFAPDENDKKRIDIRISQGQMLKGNRHAGTSVRIFSVLYDGTLTVVDPDKFRNVLQSGIGHGKVLGLGLLSVMPIRA